MLYPDRVLHVEVLEHDSRFRRPGDPTTTLLPSNERRAASRSVRLHWRGREAAGFGAVVPVVDALAELLGCLPPIDALCVLDAAREHVPWHPVPTPPLLDEHGYVGLLDRLPYEHRRIAERSSHLSQAIGETVARERLRESGIVAVPQAPLPGGYFADLLIGERLIVECELWAAFHEGGVRS